MEPIQNDIFFDHEEGSDDHKEAVMIIDDNIEIIEALSLVLKDRYLIIPCFSYEEACAKLTSKMRVVILDIKMANKDGIEIFKYAFNSISNPEKGNVLISKKLRSAFAEGKTFEQSG